jgi:SAM-dependent methyltransferase
MSFKAGGDLCLGFFQHFWDQGWLPELPQGARVLEIGCAEADWLTPMKTARPDLYLVGIDQRTSNDRPGADERILGDVLTYEFPPASFDAVIAVSMIEWAGMGHYGDPEDPDGDLKTLQNARRWIKPDGWLYFDVPVVEDSDRPRHTKMRVYSDAMFARLFDEAGWDVVTSEWFAGELDNGRTHPDGPYMAHLLRPR